MLFMYGEKPNIRLTLRMAALFILSSKNERIPFPKPKPTPLVLRSALKLKENLEESKLCSRATRCTKEGSMKEKQFRPLDIVITRRNLHEKLHSARAAKKRKGCEGILVDKMSFPENLDACFHLGQLDGSGISGPKNFPADLQDIRKPQGMSMKSSKSPKIDKESSQKVLMKKENQQPLSSEFLKLQLLKESQITQEFPSHFIRSGAKHTAIPPINPQMSSPTPYDGTNTMFQDFKVPETPLVHQVPSTSGKPQCKIILHQNEKVTCNMVPETPLLDISPLSTKNVQRKPSPFSSLKVQGKDKRQSFGKDLNIMGHTQIVPETPYLTLTLEEELLYE